MTRDPRVNHGLPAWVRVNHGTGTVLGCGTVVRPVVFTMSRSHLLTGLDLDMYDFERVSDDDESALADHASPSEAGDLSHFGKITETATCFRSPGPLSGFSGKHGDKNSGPPSLSRSTVVNMFATLTE